MKNKKQGDFDSILQWIKDRGLDYKTSDETIQIHSIFCDDHKYHLNLRPSHSNYYCCWKTGEKGDIVDLIMKLDSTCSRADAKAICGLGERRVAELEEELRQFLANKKQKISENKTSELILPSQTYLIESLPSSSVYRKKAEQYLANRKLPVQGLYVCVGGEFANRIIIPYYDKAGKLVYFNARDVTNKAKLRYRGPENGIGKSKGEVLWMKSWPGAGTKVYVVEGEFDALTLELCGVRAVAGGGKELNTTQIEMIIQYQLVLAMDNDKSGEEAMYKLREKIQSFPGKPNLPLAYVRPAKNYKDWNEMYKDHGKEALINYLQKYEKKFDDWQLIFLKNNTK